MLDHLLPSPRPLDGTPTRPDRAADRGRARWPGHLAVLLGYLAAAGWVTSGLWQGLSDRVVADYGQQDQIILEWFLTHAARSVAHLQNPLFTHQLDAPLGVNMMANAGILGLGIPLSPVTLLFGPRVSYAVLTTLALAGTAAGWYYVFVRYAVASRFAAFLGAGLCGFAPGMVSESLGHLHLVSQFLVPFIVLNTLRLGSASVTWRRAVGLGVLVAYQAFISEEILLITALGAGFFLLAWAAFAGRLRAGAGVFLRRLAVAGGTAVVLLGYPLWYQFLGPQHYRGLPFPPSLIYLDAASYWTFGTTSWFGSVAGASGLAHTRAEQTSFYGWPLLVTVIALGVWLWRTGNPLARAAAVSAPSFALLSLGYRITVYGTHLLPGPFRAVGAVPLLSLVVAARLALAVIPLVGLLVALGTERLIGMVRARRGESGDTGRRALAVGPALAPLLALVAVVAAVVSTAPRPLPTGRLAPVPDFITSGDWRGYVPPGSTLVSVPTTSSFAADGMRWSASARAEFVMPRGYFLGPTSAQDPRPLYGAVPTWTSIVLDEVALSGQVRQPAPGDAQLLAADLRYWHAAVLVLDPRQANAAQLRQTLTAFLGPPQRVDDVDLWDVRGR